MNRLWRKSLKALMAAVLGGTVMAPQGVVFAEADALTYDAAVLADQPAGYWTLDPDDGADLTGNGHDGFFTGGPLATTLPNGDAAAAFNGIDQYFTIPDHDDLELTKTGILTVEAWMRPDTLEFKNQQSSGYVHWMGKGEPGQHAWAARMYSYTNTENRPNRISGYAFNLQGGLGAGSYFQDPVTPGEWIHYTLVINTVDTSEAYPTGYTKIFKNGVLRDQDSLAGYNIIPGNGTAPIRVGTRDFASFFEGAVGKLAIYDYELTSEQLTRHVHVMNHGTEVNDIVQLAAQISVLAELSDIHASHIQEAVSLYAAAHAKAEALPPDVFPDALEELLSGAQAAILDMIERFFASSDPGRGPRLEGSVLEFLVDYAIQETGAQSLADADLVQGFVMSFVKGHATGNVVRDIVEQTLQ